MKLIRSMGLLVVALFVVSAVKANSIDPVMVVGGAGGCGTPTVVSTFSLNANANGGSNSTACPAVTVPGPVFQNGTGSTITSITVTTTIPNDPCGPSSIFGGGNLFTTAACSYDSVTQMATVVFSGMGPCGGSINAAVAVVGTCAGIAPGADFFVSLGQSGWVPLASFNGSVTTVPEPTSLTLLLSGIGLLGFLRRSWKPAA